MAKFCTKCGKPLEEGKICDCQKHEAEVATPVKTNATSNGIDVSGYVNSYLDMVKGIFTRPVEIMKQYISEEHFPLAVIAILLNCIVSGIFLYCLVKEGAGMLMSLVGYGSSSFIQPSSSDIPFMKIFLYGILFMATGFASTAVMIYVISNLLLKDTTVDIKKAFSMVGVSSVFTTVTTILCIVLIYVSMKFMVLVLLIAGIFYLTYLYQAISEKAKVDRNKLAYVFVPAISVATFVVVYVLPKILF